MILGGPEEFPNILNKKTVNIPLVPPNFFGPPTMVAVVPDFKDRVSWRDQIYPGDRVTLGTIQSHEGEGFLGE